MDGLFEVFNIHQIEDWLSPLDEGGAMDVQELRTETSSRLQLRFTLLIEVLLDLLLDLFLLDHF